MGAMAQSFQGLGTAGSAAQKIGQLGTMGQQAGLGAKLGTMGGNARGVPGFKPQRPGIKQQAGQLQQLVPPQPQPQPAPGQPAPGAGAAAPGAAPGGGGTGQAGVPPLAGPPTLTPGAAMGGNPGIIAPGYARKVLGRGGWGSSSDPGDWSRTGTTSGLPPGTVF